MTTVELVPVDKDNWRQVTKLKLAHGQEDWVAPNWYSIIEALFEGYTSRALVADGEIVGYLMTHVKPDDDVLHVVRLMISAEHQNKGYGRAALQQVLDEGRQRGDINLSRISFIPGNGAAKHLYSSLSYADTGRIEEGEHIYEAVLTGDREG